MERKAIEGIVVRVGGGSYPEDIWYEETIEYGDEALARMGYKAYVNERLRRLKEIAAAQH